MTGILSPVRLDLAARSDQPAQVMNQGEAREKFPVVQRLELVTTVAQSTIRLYELHNAKGRCGAFKVESKVGFFVVSLVHATLGAHPLFRISFLASETGTTTCEIRAVSRRGWWSVLRSRTFGLSCMAAGYLVNLVHHPAFFAFAPLEWIASAFMVRRDLPVARDDALAWLASVFAAQRVDACMRDPMRRPASLVGTSELATRVRRRRAVQHRPLHESAGEIRRLGSGAAKRT
jgi:hypothetical protein